MDVEWQARCDRDGCVRDATWCQTEWLYAVSIVDRPEFPATFTVDCNCPPPIKEESA